MIISFIIFAAALFIDGATDCANSVTAAVSSRAVSLPAATLLSAVCTFFGCTVFCLFFPLVAQSSAVAVFPEGTEGAAIAISLLSVALWSGAAWIAGLPTSEGHALAFASAGAALALGGTVDVTGLLSVVLSIIPAALVSSLFSLAVSLILRRVRNVSFRTPLIVSSAVSSFFHGAQDGQKFLSLAIAASLSQRLYTAAALSAALFMALGTLFGRRIIEKMGTEMVNAGRTTALSSDMGSGLSLALLTALGIPASTTHVKMTSLAFTSLVCGERTDRDTFLRLCCAWVVTFPASFAVSFSISKLFLAVFL